MDDRFVPRCFRLAPHAPLCAHCGASLVFSGAFPPPASARGAVAGFITLRNSSSALRASSAAATPPTGFPWIVPVISQLCHISCPLHAGTILISQPAEGADNCQPEGKS